MKGFLITPKYADGIKYTGTSKQQISGLEKKVPELLKKLKLTVNNSKAEKIVIRKITTTSSNNSRYENSDVTQKWQTPLV